jgi:16S rRNA (guanine527-N7)-methyltransferase
LSNVSFPFLSEMGLTQAQAEAFARYREQLLEWNARVNLTAITEPREIEVKHFLDSLLLRDSALWQESMDGSAQPLRVADVGGGAGFPGMPLKIAYERIALDTLEASRKKVAFLQTLAESLGLEETRAFHLRAEEAGQDAAFREGFDWALSRGLASVSVLLEYCLPLLKLGGYMAAYKGPAGRAEAEEAEKAAALCGGSLAEVVSAALPEGQGERCILIYRKVKATPKRYPRRPGIPAKQPLA